MTAADVSEGVVEERPWALVEFGGAALGAPRRTARLLQLATRLAERPSASLPEALPTRADLVGAYRFFGNRCIDPAALLPSHVHATQRRLAAVPLVLAVQDTTLLDDTAHPATSGLGLLGTSHTRGLVVHTTLAITPERVPLGLLAQAVWARDGAGGKRAARKQRPTAAKESQKWRESLTAVAAAKAACPQTQVVSVGDREADVYDRLATPQPAGVALLVRAAWDRAVTEPEGRLWARAEAAPVVGSVVVHVPRQGRQPARTAVLSLRCRAVTRCPPRARRRERLAALGLWLVLAREETPPAGTEPLDWLLLTTLPTETADEAATRVAWYACRWGIEVWHRVLKSGCRIEARQLDDAQALRRSLAVYRVVAWRLAWATMLARDLPDAPASLLLEREEWEALCCAVQQVPTPPPEPPSRHQAVRLIARLGGFLGRAGDGEPGVTTLWRGIQHLADLTHMDRIMKPPPLPDNCV